MGQRKYGGPPPDWTQSPPPAGSEIFVGRIPKDVYEDELIVLFEKIGKLWDLRLMIDPLTSQSRGYGFITYCNKEDALKAVQEVLIDMNHNFFNVLIFFLISFDSLMAIKFDQKISH